MMPSPASPRLRVAGACLELGNAAVVRRCLRLLAGGSVDPGFVVMLGGRPALHLLNDGIPEQQSYWLRVWAARGLLWADLSNNTTLPREALSDESWRVREMLCKVVARHRLGDLLDEVAVLESDPIPRVRAAASRAVVRIVEAQV